MSENQKNILPLILIILDGWGIGKDSRGNAIGLAKTPTMDGLSRKYPFTTLHASGKWVGLPDEQCGNSEAGHMNIGAGRLVEQDSVKITRSIEDGTFYKNTAILEAFKNVKKNKSRLHIMGMLSNGMSPHSDPNHLMALLKMAKINGMKDPVLHLFTDGRDSPKYASLKLIHELAKEFTNGETVGTIMGRFYAMDRTKKWDRTEKAYLALTQGIGRTAESAHSAVTEGYNRGESDEYIEPYVISKKGKASPCISSGDSVIFFNLRSDRSRQLAKAFMQDEFIKHNQNSFKRKKILEKLVFVGMTDFGPDLNNILIAFPSSDLRATLPMQLSHLRQSYVAETEKYAHVTYFFNGGYSGKVSNEDQIMIPSPDVKFYNETPEMSTRQLSRTVISNLNEKKYDFTLLNFAAPDMIGHTGDLNAGIRCCEAVDKYLGRIVKAYLEARGTVIITADHGNIEEMINLETGEINTEHSVNSVPFLVVNKILKNSTKLAKGGSLSDIAPTILKIIGLKKPKEMSGKSLIK